MMASQNGDAGLASIGETGLASIYEQMRMPQFALSFYCQSLKH